MNLTTKWRHLYYLQFWPPNAATCISSEFDHQKVPLELVANLDNIWKHLHWFQIWPPGWLDESHALPHCLGSSYKDHQIAPLANLTTSCHHLHWLQILPPLLALVRNMTTRLTGWVTCIATLPWIALLALSVSIGLVSPSARVTSVKFQKRLGVT